MQEIETSKPKIILKIINLLTEAAEFNTFLFKFGIVNHTKLENIIQKENLFHNINIDDIISKNYKIYLDDFNDTKKYYDILFDIFLKKINDFRDQDVILFKRFNQAFFYCKFIKYLIKLVDNQPKCIDDDIIKNKMYEIIKTLNSDDKLYSQDFYFMVSLLHLNELYKKEEENLIPNFTSFKNNLYGYKYIIEQIFIEKRIILQNMSIIIQQGTNKILYDYFFNMLNENLNNNFIDELTNQFNNIDNQDFSPNFLTKSEIELKQFLIDNKLVDELNEILKKCDKNLLNKYNFYYSEQINQFLNLDKEHIYVIINSLTNLKNLNFCEFIMKYTSNLNSYIEGLKSGVELKNKIKHILEDKSFYNLIRDIYNSKKMKDYFLNPIQYILYDNKGITKYYEKKEEYELIVKNKNLKNISDKKVSNFTINKDKNNDIDTKKKENFNTDEDNENNENNDNNNLNTYVCQLYKDYDYFMNNIFDENFFKKRIIYSFLPVGIKAYVEELPKIIFNVSGNSILTYSIDKNSNDYNKIIEASCVIIIVHEIIHLMRRQNINFKHNTPIGKNMENYEGGRSLIYHIFNEFKLDCIDLSLANAILNVSSWNNEELKEALNNLGYDSKAREKYLQQYGGIKFYDSNLDNEFDDYMIEDDSFGFSNI